MEFYTLAADQDVACAQFNLGAMYYNGKGVDQSYTKAIEWISKAAAQGYELHRPTIPLDPRHHTIKNNRRLLMKRDFFYD